MERAFLKYESSSTMTATLYGKNFSATATRQNMVPCSKWETCISRTRLSRFKVHCFTLKLKSYEMEA